MSAVHLVLSTCLFLPLVNKSSRWCPVFRAHINMCLSFGLGQFNRLPHMNPGLLHDQGHKIPCLQKAKTHISLSFPSATQPLVHSALHPQHQAHTLQANPPSQPSIIPNTRPDPLPPSSPTTTPTSRHAHPAQSNYHRSHPSSPLEP